MNLRDLLGKDLPDFEIIDIHAHMNGPALFMCPGNPDIEGMIAAMDRVGVSRIAIAPNMAINCDIVIGNQMVLKAAEKYPNRVIGLATLNFNHFEESIESLEKCFATPYFKGIKLHPDFMNYTVKDSEKMKVVMDYARKYRAFFISHTDSRLDPGHLALKSDPNYFEPYIREYSDVNFILAHCGLTYGGYISSIRLANQYSNVYLDTTGFRFSNTWTVEGIARKAGVNKVVFGSDMPWNDIGSAVSRIILSELPIDARIKMLGENGKRVMKEI